jgi:hypothetical protein
LGSESIAGDRETDLDRLRDLDLADPAGEGDLEADLACAGTATPESLAADPAGEEDLLRLPADPAGLADLEWLPEASDLAAGLPDAADLGVPSGDGDLEPPC